MKAAIVKGKGEIVVEDVPDPKARRGLVVLKIEYCGICGSDVHFLQTGFLKPGSMLGHEFSARVVEVGESVQEVTVGDRVTLGQGTMCGTCAACRQGRYELCLRKGNVVLQKDRSAYGRGFGGFAEYLLIHPRMLTKVPDNVTDREAALTEPLSVACLGVHHAKLTLGESTVVLGAGPIGLLLQQTARAAGAASVFVAELSERRAAMARQLGADRVFNPLTCSLPDEVFRLTGLGADVVFECAGGPSTLQLAVDTVREHGRVVLVAVRMEDSTVRPMDWILKQVELKAYFGGHFPSAIALLEAHKVAVEPLITDVIGLEDLQSMCTSLLRPNDQIKVLVRPSA